MDGHYLEELGYKNPVLTDEKEQQLSGSDLIAYDDDGNKIIADVKAVASVKLPTFCQELGNMRSGRIGWIARDDIKTDDYVYVYHELPGNPSYSKGKKMIALSADYISGNQIIRCKRDKVRKLISESFGIEFNEGSARKIIRQITGLIGDIDDVSTTLYFNVEEGKVNKVSKKEHNAIYVTLSGKVYEKPLNVVIPKTMLISISESCYIN